MKQFRMGFTAVNAGKGNRQGGPFLNRGFISSELTKSPSTDQLAKDASTEESITQPATIIAEKSTIEPSQVPTASETTLKDASISSKSDSIQSNDSSTIAPEPRAPAASINSKDVAETILPLQNLKAPPIISKDPLVSISSAEIIHLKPPAAPSTPKPPPIGKMTMQEPYYQPIHKTPNSAPASYKSTFKLGSSQDPKEPQSASTKTTDPAPPVKIRKTPGPKPGWKKRLAESLNNTPVSTPKPRGRAKTKPASLLPSFQVPTIETPSKTNLPSTPSSNVQGKYRADSSTSTTPLNGQIETSPSLSTTPNSSSAQTHHFNPFQYPQHKSRANPPIDLSTVRGKHDYTEPPEVLQREFNLQNAPIFRPSLEEFKDPASYVAKISNVGKKFGMVKIIPPDSWNPPFSLDSDVSLNF